MGIRSKTHKQIWFWIFESVHARAGPSPKKTICFFFLKPFTCSGTENRSAEGKTCFNPWKPLMDPNVLMGCQIGENLGNELWSNKFAIHQTSWSRDCQCSISQHPLGPKFSSLPLRSFVYLLGLSSRCGRGKNIFLEGLGPTRYIYIYIHIIIYPHC